MEVWVVSFKHNGHFDGDAQAFVSKKALLDVLKLRGYDLKRVIFEKSFSPYDIRETWVRYYGDDADDRGFYGELQYLVEEYD